MTDMLIEGYAALFGVADMAGDVVRAGAFARTLSAGARPMLYQHRPGKVAGRWVRMTEDGRGLYVRGLIEDATPEGRAAISLARQGKMDGLSIGFRPVRWSPRVGGGRDLTQIELVEVSLVAFPMAPRARFVIVGQNAKVAA